MAGFAADAGKGFIARIPRAGYADSETVDAHFLNGKVHSHLVRLAGGEQMDTFGGLRQPVGAYLQTYEKGSGSFKYH